MHTLKNFCPLHTVRLKEAVFFRGSQSDAAIISLVDPGISSDPAYCFSHLVYEKQFLYF